MTEEIAFVGDIVIPDQLQSTVTFGGPWVGNLEAPITRGRSPLTGKIALRSADLGVLRALGSLPIAVSLANNHIMDFGPGGLDDTLAALRAGGVRWFGVGSEADNYANPHVVEIGGVIVGLLGYVSETTHPVTVDGIGPALLDPARVRRDIARARARGATRIAMSVHWGTEESPLPAVEDRDVATTLLQAGADVIVGHHSHCVQATETVRGRPAYYGLGNFLMPDLAPGSASLDSSNGLPFWKKQLSWAQQSLVVRWRPADNASSVDFVEYRGGTLAPASRPMPVPELVLNGSEYARRVAEASRTARWRARAAAVLGTPFSDWPRFSAVVMRSRLTRLKKALAQSPGDTIGRNDD